MFTSTAFPLHQAIEPQAKTLPHDTRVIDALIDMDQRGCSYVLVTDPQQRLLGIFTERGLVQLTAEEKPLTHLTLADVMLRNPPCLEESQLDNILTVLNYMGDRHIRHLPILSQGIVIGAITHESIRQLLNPIDLLRLRRVEEVMAKTVVCTQPSQSVLDLARILHQHQISCLLVTETGMPEASRPQGIVTEHDILRLHLRQPPMTDAKAADIMKAPVLCIQPHVTLWQAHEKMQAGQVRRLAVTDEQGYLTGLLTQTGLMRGLDLVEAYLTIDTLQHIIAERTTRLDTANRTLQKKVQERKRAKAALQHQIARERLVTSIAQRIRQSLQLNEILNTTVHEVRQFLKAERAFIYQFQAETCGQIAIECTGTDCLSIQGQAELTAILNQIDPEFYQKGRRIYSIPDLQATKLPSPDLQIFRRLPMRSLVVAPILTQHSLWGLLIVNQCSGPRRWEKLEIDLLKQLATQVGIAIQQAELYAQLEAANARLDQLAHADGLTQVANRRRFDEYLQQEWRRSARAQQPLSLLMADIDYFKSFNDTYGHQAGDACLIAVAQAIQGAVKRPADLVARYGGEEFVVILPGTPLAGAVCVAQAMQARVKALNIPHERSAVSDWVTLSLGVAEAYPQPHQSPLGLTRWADQALYQAKAQGRDRLVQAPQVKDIPLT